MARRRYRPGLAGGRPARTGPDQWQNTMREYEERASAPLTVYFDLNTTAADSFTTAAGATGVTFTVGYAGGATISGGEVTLLHTGLYTVFVNLSIAATASAYGARLAFQTMEPGGSWTDYAVSRNTKDTTNINSGVTLATPIAIRVPNTKMRITLTAENNNITLNASASNYLRGVRHGPPPFETDAF